MKKLAIVYGSLFLTAGLIKWSHIENFRSAVRLFDLLNPSLLEFATQFIPRCEIIVGGALLANTWSGGAFLWCEALLYTFAAATMSVKARGLNISCGCFGDYSPEVSWAHVLACLAGAGLLTWSRWKNKTRAAAADSPSAGM